MEKQKTFWKNKIYIYNSRLEDSINLAAMHERMENTEVAEIFFNRALNYEEFIKKLERLLLERED